MVSRMLSGVCLLLMAVPPCVLGLMTSPKPHVALETSGVLGGGLIKMHEMTRAAYPEITSNFDQSPSRRLLQGSYPITFDVSISYTPGTANSTVDHLGEKLIPPALGYLQKALKVKVPVSGNLTIPRACTKFDAHNPKKCIEWQKYCVTQEIPDQYWAPGPAGKGGPGVNSDHILTIIALGSSSQPLLKDWGCVEDGIAWSRSCAWDPHTNRPIMSEIIICNANSFAKLPFDLQLRAFANQVTVAMGFNADTWRLGRMANGAGVAEKGKPGQFWKNVTHDDGSVHEYITTPKATQEARAHYACPTLPGLMLEDDGGPGIAGQSLDNRLYWQDLMNSGYIVYSSYHRNKKFSRFILAFLDDTNWYTVNYGVAGYTTWGRGAGCAFAMGSYAETLKQNSPNAKRFLCEVSKKDPDYGCTWNALSIYDDCSFPPKSDPDYLLFNGFPLSSEITLKPGQEACNAGQRCVVTNPNTANRGAQCWNTKCEGNALFLVAASGVKVRCPTGQTVTLPTGAHGGFARAAKPAFVKTVGPCPDNAMMCGKKEPALGSALCPGDCSRHGDCDAGRCVCHIGYTGKDCNALITWDAIQRK